MYNCLVIMLSALCRFPGIYWCIMTHLIVVCPGPVVDLCMFVICLHCPRARYVGVCST